MSGRRALLLAVGVLLASGTAHPVAAREVLFLRDNWRLQSSARVGKAGAEISAPAFRPDGWYPVSVPTTVLAALVENGVYPDPYYGDNLKSIPGYREGRWLVMPADSPFRSSWWYRREFAPPAGYRGRNIMLHLDGINYQANIWLNGQQIAGSDTVVGMPRRFEFDISSYVRAGRKNCLALEIIGPGQGPDIRYSTKQIEATTGWDDHNPYPPDMNMGIWQEVYITATGPARMRYPYVAADLNAPRLDVARLTVTVEAANTTGRPITTHVTGSIEKITFSRSIRLRPNETRLVRFSPDEFRQLSVHRPRVWWPNPIGPQELYDLKLVARVDGKVSDVLGVRFGIRDAATYINEEGWRAYKINGRRILIRGAAWMTNDMLLRLSRKRYDALIRYAAEANLNMLRSEGFSIRETEDFYGLCDKYGIMVAQQIFGRSIPDEDLAIACVKDMILRIRNHPSLVHFLGHDETFPSPRLDRAYRELIAKYAPDRTYQPNSGAFDIEERFKTGGTRTGSRELWTYATPAHYYVDKEKGAWGFAQSGGIGGVISPIESMRRMMPADALWPPWTEKWSFHTVIQGGRYYDALLSAMKARYGEPAGIEDFCMKGQVMNYESSRAMYEAYARNKYSATGITAWKYDAAWPASPTWQFVDWYLLAGGAYYGAKNACQPLHVQYSYDDHSIYVVNGYYRDFKDLKVTARVFNLDMTEKYSRIATVDVPADGKTNAFTIEWPDGLTRTRFLALRLEDSSGKDISNNLYWLSAVPDIPGTEGYTEDRVFYMRPKSAADHRDLSRLPQVKLNADCSIEDKGREKIAWVRVHNPTRSLAFFIHLAILKGEKGQEVTPTFWEENYFSLLPAETRLVRARFAVEDLDGAKPVLAVGGWNIRSSE